MPSGPPVYAAVFVAVVGIILLVTLLPMSFHRVSFDEVAISYNKLTKNLGDELLREGLHNLGPSGSLIKFKITQRTIDVVGLDALTTDGITVTLDVQVAYSVKMDDIPIIVDEFANQPDHEEFLGILARSVIYDTSLKFTAQSFYLQREDFQNTLHDDMTRAFAEESVHAIANIIQVQNIELPSSVHSALSDTTTQKQDVQNAITERARKVQEAEIALNLTRHEAALLVLEAEREVDKIDQESNEAVLAERNRILQRSLAFGNISAGLGLGGDFFVNSYLKALVTQSNQGKTVVSLE